MAIAKLAKYGTPQLSTNFQMFENMTREILKTPLLTSQSLVNMKKMLFSLVYGSSSASKSTNAIPSIFQKLLMIAHLMDLREKCIKNPEFNTLVAKQSISLLRYTDILRPDIAFYKAGKDAKTAELFNMAFVIWNRYIDISEAIEEGQGSLNDNTDFANTDVPFDISLPRENLQVRFILDI